MGLEIGVSVACIVVTAVILWLLARSSARKTHTATPPPAAIEVDVANGSRCGDCAFFDHQEGQAILRLYPAFPREDLPPCLIGAQYDKDTGGLLRNEAVPARCSWDDFGACSRHTELRWSEDKCPDFKRRSRRAA